jgi:hypothetical protein
VTECVVKCQLCRDEEDRPKKWRYLCEECADEQGARHRKDTGHECEMVITRDAKPEQAFRMIADAGRLAADRLQRRRGW